MLRADSTWRARIDEAGSLALKGSNQVRAILGWGRPLYDERLARIILQQSGIQNPSEESVRHYAKQLRNQTLAIRIISIVCGILGLLFLFKVIP